MLSEIVARVQRDLPARRQACPLAELQERAQEQAPPLDLLAALRRPGVQVIAEIKRASPSRGLLRPDLDPVALARAYAAHGAAAVSVLTEPHFFQGQPAYLSAIRGALQATPLLRKDFILDPYQVFEARALGADALLLIAAVLSDAQLEALLALTRELGMAALVEVHDAAEVERVLPLQPRLIGINNRRLRDFTVDLRTFERLRPRLPAAAATVAESGVHTAADVRRMGQAGADAVLVGEALVTAPDVGVQMRELAAGGQP